MMFVLRTFPRCGTHMVRTALERHPEITMHNEIFNPDHTPIETINRLGVDGMVNRYGRGDHEGFCVHGFTEMEKSAQRASLPFWNWAVKHQPTMLVLERRDLLRRVFSNFQAQETNRWHVWKTQKNRPVLPVPMAPSGATRWYLAASIESMKFSREHFPNAAYFSYEDLCDNWNEEMARLQAYLGVQPYVLSPMTAKQDTRPIDKMVSNYRALKEEFAADDKLRKYLKWFEFAEANDESRRTI